MEESTAGRCWYIRTAASGPRIDIALLQERTTSRTFQDHQANTFLVRVLHPQLQSLGHFLLFFSFLDEERTYRFIKDVSDPVDKDERGFGLVQMGRHGAHRVEMRGSASYDIDMR